MRIFIYSSVQTKKPFKELQSLVLLVSYYYIHLSLAIMPPLYHGFFYGTYLIFYHYIMEICGFILIDFYGFCYVVDWCMYTWMQYVA